jgi:hypothetical protein
MKTLAFIDHKKELVLPISRFFAILQIQPLVKIITLKLQFQLLFVARCYLTET